MVLAMGLAACATTTPAPTDGTAAKPQPRTGEALGQAAGVGAAVIGGILSFFNVVIVAR